MSHLPSLFFDTGIPEFNDLLTRNPSRGIACPHLGEPNQAHPSSTMVIRAPAGTGKSVLCALLAHNLHGVTQFGEAKERLQTPTGKSTETRKGTVPYCVYFSFAQPAAGLYYYINDILRGNLANTPTDPTKIPLILSPRSVQGFAETSGIETLRLCLIDLLNELSPHAFATKPDDGSQRIKAFENAVKKSPDWETDGQDHWFVPGKGCEVRPVVFVDPVNFLFDRQDSRQAVARLFAMFRALQWPLIVTLEDSGSEADLSFRMLSSHVEFEADVVIHLGVRSDPYFRRTIEVKKNRHGPARFGHQLFRIERPGHSLWNVPWHWKHPPPKAGKEPKYWPGDPGFFIFPSIHSFLSRERERRDVHFYSSTGIDLLDEQITQSKVAPECAKALPTDASILIRGDKGGHKLSLGFNLLVAGLSNEPELKADQSNPPQGPAEVASTSRTVLFISLGEETHNAIMRIALSDPNLEHRLVHHDEELSLPDGRTLLQAPKGSFKVGLDCWRDKASSRIPISTAIVDPAQPKLIEASFKPGFLSPEEFLWIIESLVTHFRPCRMMIENTAHLHTRFPELAKEVMLFPALSSLTRHVGSMLIVTDVMGNGASKKLSRGLAAGADYIIEVSDFSEVELKKVVKCLRRKKVLPRLNAAKCQWAKLALSNVRGKNYRYERSAVTVYDDSQGNKLFIEDVTSVLSPFSRAKRRKKNARKPLRPKKF